MGIKGNEKADVLAKRGTLEPQDNKHLTQESLKHIFKKFWILLNLNRQKNQQENSGLAFKTLGKSFVKSSVKRLRQTLDCKQIENRRPGRGSLVVKVSDRSWHVTSSGRVPLKTRRVGKRSMLNLSRAQMSSRWSPFPRYAEDSSSFLLVLVDHVGRYRFLKQRGDFHWLTGIRIGRDRQGDVNMVTSS
ncbi:hypothetical protein TNCV_3637451 [Trichonephila clavipes]|nr:hypothetical protein TNCV_3637451 [Trichonephila clavipes]